MNKIFLRWSPISFAIGIFAILSSNYAIADDIYEDAANCALAGGVYESGICLGINYYAPYGYSTIYKGWKPGYYVGPVRNREEHNVNHSSAHSYRPAPASHSMPTIPEYLRSESRGGSHLEGGYRSH